MTETNSQQAATKPAFRSSKIENGFQLSFALPGLDRDEIEIGLEKRTLTIRGEKSQNEDKRIEPRRYLFRVQLHDDLNLDTIQAVYQDGVLNLTLSKKQELIPRKISILAN